MMKPTLIVAAFFFIGMVIGLDALLFGSAGIFTQSTAPTVTAKQGFIPRATQQPSMSFEPITLKSLATKAGF